LFRSPNNWDSVLVKVEKRRKLKLKLSQWNEIPLSGIQRVNIRNERTTGLEHYYQNMNKTIDSSMWNWQTMGGGVEVLITKDV